MGKKLTREQIEDAGRVLGERFVPYIDIEEWMRCEVARMFCAPAPRREDGDGD